jgi:uncharacterized protein involved in exopolysaccharide biosynthesis
MTDYPTSRDRGTEETMEISLLGMINALLRQRRLLLALPLLLMAGFTVYAVFEREPSFTATARFIPEGASAPDVPASLARELGTGGEPGGSAAFYAELLTSRELLKSAAAETYIAEMEDGRVRGTLPEIYGIEAADSKEAREIAARRLKDRIETEVARGTRIVTLRVTQRYPELAEEIADRLLTLVDRFNRETRQSQATAELEYLSEREKEARDELREAESALRDFLQANRAFRSSPELVFEHDRLQREVTLRQELVTSLARSSDRAEMEQARNTPLITVVEGPEGSATRDPSSWVLTASVVGLLLGLVIVVVTAFVVEFFRRTREGTGRDHEEFEVLRRATASDLRHALAWAGRRRRPSPPGSGREVDTAETRRSDAG